MVIVRLCRNLPQRMDISPEHLDVLIVGAGLSGIGAGCHLQERCPEKTYAILEARGDLGGTWDLFRYPGIRSDSDMHTLGYRFKPWTDAKSIADGASILRYVRQAAAEHGIEEKIRFRPSRRGGRVLHRGVSLDAWRSNAPTAARRSASLAASCGCAAAITATTRATPPISPARSASPAPSCTPSTGREDIDYAGKRVVVIGSGATAVTLVPALG